MKAIHLPEEIFAIGDVAARYDVRYHDYRLAGVTAIVR